MVIDLVQRYECTASNMQLFQGSILRGIYVVTRTFFDNSNYFTFPTLKYVNYDNSRGPQRRPYSLIYILTTFFNVAEFGWLSK